MIKLRIKIPNECDNDPNIDESKVSCTHSCPGASQLGELPTTMYNGGVSLVLLIRTNFGVRFFESFINFDKGKKAEQRSSTPGHGARSGRQSRDVRVHDGQIGGLHRVSCSTIRMLWLSCLCLQCLPAWLAGGEAVPARNALCSK
jgi:hypothetical protein